MGPAICVLEQFLHTKCLRGVENDLDFHEKNCFGTNPKIQDNKATCRISPHDRGTVDTNDVILNCMWNIDRPTIITADLSKKFRKNI